MLQEVLRVLPVHRVVLEANPAVCLDRPADKQVRKVDHRADPRVAQLAELRARQGCPRRVPEVLAYQCPAPEALLAVKRTEQTAAQVAVHPVVARKMKASSRDRVAARQARRHPAERVPRAEVDRREE